MPGPPVAQVRPVTDTYFGTEVVDNYRYLENLDDPEVQAWMKAQAHYTRATLDGSPAAPRCCTHPCAEQRRRQPRRSDPAR